MLTCFFIKNFQLNGIAEDHVKYSKLLINALLFFTIPSIVAYPQSEIPTVNIHSKEISHEADVKERIFQNDQLFSYDDVLSLLQDLEEGKLEKRYSAEELEKLNHFLSFLAKQGVLPNEVKEQYILQNDIEDLLYSNQNSYEYAYFPHQGEEYVIASSVFSSQGEIVFCKSWIQKQWSQTKKFVKKHKKAIIIGTAVVVAAATVVCVVAVASAASAVAVAAAGPNREKIDKPQEQDNQGPGAPFSLPVMIVENEAPILNAVIDEYVSTFKEGIVEENFLRSSTNLKDYGDDYFCENIRNLGAKLAHETLDGVSELISCVPLLLDEIKSIGVRIVPDFSLLNDGIEIIPMEKYEKLVAIGHEEIDHIFSTSQASRYTSEEAVIDLIVGIIPLPGLFKGISVDVSQLVEAGKVLDRAGFTKAGRSLVKHSYRESSIFPKPIGNPAQINEHGQKVLESILNHPEKKVVPGEFARFGKVVDIYAPEIGGIRYSVDGEFIGFLEL